MVEYGPPRPFWKSLLEEGVYFLISEDTIVS